jgi:regulator of nucleoside diphosphate kinase
LAEVTLVLPDEADVSQGKVSVLTPVGAALIGMWEGRSITFTARRGTRRITVLTVGRREALDAAGGRA